MALLQEKKVSLSISFKNLTYFRPRGICLLLVFSSLLWEKAHTSLLGTLFNQQSKTTQAKFSLAPVVKKASPAVVNVYAIKKNNKHYNLLQEFFGEAFKLTPFPPRVESSLGSGVIIREDGLIATNDHVIDDADEINVVTEDDKEYKAEILVRDKRMDLALLKIEGSHPFVPLEPMEELEVGDIVCAIGNPFSLGQSVTMGCISALARDGITANDPRVFIQTDAAINRGNSGGALVTLDGKLAGINTFIVSRSGGNIGLGFAIPSDFLQALIQAADKKQPVQRPWSGLSLQQVTKNLAHAYGMDKPYGVLVANVSPSSSAAAARIEKGDLITHVNDTCIPNQAMLMFILNTRIIGTTLFLTVTNYAKETRKITLELQPPPKSASKPEHISGRVPLAGCDIDMLSPATAEEFGLSHEQKGLVIVDVKRGSTAYQIGFRRGDILEEMNGVSLETLDDLHRSLRREFSGWRIIFNRNGYRQRIDLR